MNRPIRCGFAAILDPARSMHTQTVLRALDIYKALFAHDTIEFICCEDFGSVEGGAHAADLLVSQGVDIVVGHYASNSAMGAAPFYAAHAVPVLLPTATDTQLTLDRNNIFRLCPNNTDIVNALLSFFSPDEQFNFDVFTDESSYAQNLASILKNTLVERSARSVNKTAVTSNIVFIGTGTRSEMFLEACERKAIPGPFMLTDDAACPHFVIPGSMRAGQVRGVGFASTAQVNPTAPCAQEYVRRYGELPGVFFLETIAALEIVSHLTAKSEDFVADLNAGSFLTSLGELRFVRGERQHVDLCLWRNDEANQFRPVELIKPNKEPMT